MYVLLSTEIIAHCLSTEIIAHCCGYEGGVLLITYFDERATVPLTVPK